MSLIPVPAAMQAATRGFYPKVINGSLRFNDDDSAYLSYRFAAGNQKVWTWSGWVKRGNLTGSSQQLMARRNSTNSERLSLAFDSSDKLTFLSITGGTTVGDIQTNAVFRDPSAWYHVVYALDAANTSLKIYVNGVEQSVNVTTAISNTDHQFNALNAIAELGRLPNAAVAYLDGYLADVHFIDGQALTADDFGELKNGVWVAKDYAGTYGTNGFYLTFEDDTEVEAFNTVLYRGNGGTQSITGVGFSPDLVWAKKRGSTAASHRLLDTVRGVQKNLYSDLTSAEQTQNSVISFDSDGFTVGDSAGTNGSGDTFVAWCWDAGANNAVTGHSSVIYTGNGGTQKISGFGFSPDLVWIKDRSNARDSVIFDTVRGAANYLRSASTAAEGTSTTTLSSFDKDGFILGNNAANNNTSETYVAWGWDAGDSDPVSNTDGSITSTVKASTTNGFSIVSWTGTGTAGTIGHGLAEAPTFIIAKCRTFNTATGSGTHWPVYHTGVGPSDIPYLSRDVAPISAAQVWNATAPTGASDAIPSVFSVGTNVNTNAAPTGGTADYVAYCWHDVTGKQKFGTYTGNNTATGPTVDLGFRPGFVMIKNADGTGNWNIFDGSRFPFADNDLFLRANLANAEVDGSGEGADAYEVEFTSTGFIPKASGASSRSQVNGSGTYIYAAFAGSYSDYITDYNTDGSIDSRVKASDTTGFSMVSYTGSTSESVGHGLSSAPKFIIVKDRSAASSWAVYHQSVQDTTANGFLELNSTAAVQTGSNPRFLSGTAGTSQPTSTVFYVNNYSGSSTNNTGNDYIAYCWTETTGYSKFGSYNGDSTTDGSHEINVGFKPAMVIIKHATGAYNGDWFLYDNTRDVPNGDSYLRPNLSSAETANGGMLQLTDTGFAFYTNSGSHNQSGFGYIYAAFADTREAAFWLDQSGNDNDWQPVNLDHNDTVADSPTDNFATWNPLAKLGSVALPTFSDGNLTLTTNASVDTMAVATMGITSGTFYYEATLRSANTYHQFGVASKTDSITTSTDRVTYFGFNGYIYNNATSTGGYGTNSAGDVLGVACDADAGTVKFYLNNTLLSTESWTSNTGLYIPFMAGSNGTYTADVNFGQQPFKYDPPA
jgi:hypothetical protein